MKELEAQGEKKFLRRIECVVSEKNAKGAILLKTELLGRGIELSSDLKIFRPNFLMHGPFIIEN